MEIPMILAAALPWLFILACPLVMWWMMRSMGCDKPSAEGAVQAGRADGEEIRRLKERIADLETARQDARSVR